MKHNLKDVINNKPVSVQIMAWRGAGNKLLSAQMMAYFTDAYMSRSVSVSYHTRLTSHELIYQQHAKTTYNKTVLFITYQ